VHHQSILLNNQCDAALSSHIYSSLQDNLAEKNKYNCLKAASRWLFNKIL
jgi:hypothetical protein